jgi:hypothetical protein
MATLDEILGQLQQEEVPLDINFSAPEPGAFPPAFAPTGGKDNPPRPFVFHLMETDPFTIADIQSKKWLQCNFVAHVDVNGTERKINFQRATTFKNDRMNNSAIGDLIRSLDLQEVYEQNRQETGDFNQAIVRTLQQADGRAAGLADFGWTVAFKEALTVFKTNTNKVIPAKAAGKYTVQPWPRDAQNQFLPTVADPTTGEEKYGNLEITRFRIAKKDSSASVSA